MNPAHSPTSEGIIPTPQDPATPESDPVDPQSLNPTTVSEPEGIVPPPQGPTSTESESATSQPTLYAPAATQPSVPQLDEAINSGRAHNAFDLFGQRGITPLKRTLPKDWPNTPFHRPQSSRFLIQLLPSDIPLLTLGFLPIVLDTHLPPPHAPGADGQLDRTVPMAHTLPTRVMEEETRATDDMWFIYSDGPDSQGLLRVNFHRSWTGVKVFELIIDVGCEGAHHDMFRSRILGQNGEPRVLTIAWETQPEYVFLDGREKTVKDVARKVCGWVLGVALGPEEGTEGTTA